MLVFGSLVRNSVVLAVYLLFSFACFFTAHEHCFRDWGYGRGIPKTAVSKESIFSDLKNLEVVTATSEKYADCFGFTEGEVFEALEEFGMRDRKQKVKN